MARKNPTPPASPIGGLMDRRFVYVPAAATDIRKTFERVRAAPLIPTPKKAQP